MSARSDARTEIIKFHRVYPGAIAPMKAERSALGTIPAGAHQYCEPLCSASAFGWYIFPPADIRLLWNGVDVFHEVEGEWQPLVSNHLPGMVEQWNQHCPDAAKDMAPPFLTSLFAPGLVQVWSGMLVSTADDWSLLIRPLANVPQSRMYACFEGLVESDKFKPVPLFTNIRLTATDVPIEILRIKPLFQVQPIPRIAYTRADAAEVIGAEELSDEEWVGYLKRVRRFDPALDSHVTGEYAVSVRKRAKRDA